MRYFLHPGKFIGDSPVPVYLYSQVNPTYAQTAYNAFLDFKVVVVVLSVFWLPSSAC